MAAIGFMPLLDPHITMCCLFDEAIKVFFKSEPRITEDLRSAFSKHQRRQNRHLPSCAALIIRAVTWLKLILTSQNKAICLIMR